MRRVASPKEANRLLDFSRTHNIDLTHPRISKTETSPKNGEAIEKALNYLKYHDPANAKREYAIGLLERMQATASSVADKTSLDFDKFTHQDDIK